MSTTNKLVLDIETIGEDFDALDHATQENLTRWIKKDSDSEDEYKIALQDLKNGLGFSPLNGRDRRDRPPRLLQKRGCGILPGAGTRKQRDKRRRDTI